MFRKFISRKLFAVVASVLVGAWAPWMIPFLKVLVPTYVGAQGVADAAANLRDAIRK